MTGLFSLFMRVSRLQSSNLYTAHPFITTFDVLFCPFSIQYVNFIGAMLPRRRGTLAMFTEIQDNFQGLFSCLLQDQLC